MDFLEQHLVDDASSAAPSPASPVILLALPAGADRKRWQSIGSQFEATLVIAGEGEEARRALSRDRVSVAVIHHDFDNRSGLRLGRHIRRCQLRSQIVFLSAEASFDVAAEAVRLGASDILVEPADDESLRYAIECALQTWRSNAEREERSRRLREVCRRLSDARQESARQVDILCQDLASAYDDVAGRISEATMASEFRTLLSQELDLEGLLRTTLEYLLTKTGPTNAAVFLPDADQNYSLGAYVNYDCPREEADVLLEHFCHTLCPHMEEEEQIVCFEDVDALAEHFGDDAKFLEGSQVLALRSMQGEECLAVMVLFRKRSSPYPDDLAVTLDALRPIFARQMVSVINVHHRARPQWPAEAEAGDDEAGFEADADDDYGFGFAA